MHACMHVCMNVRVHACMRGRVCFVCVCVAMYLRATTQYYTHTHTQTHMTSARQSPRASVMLPAASHHNPESLNPRDTTPCPLLFARDAGIPLPPAPCTARTVHAYATSALGSRGSGPAYSRTFCVGVATGAAGLDHCPPHGTRAGESAPLAGAPPRPSTIAPVDAQLRTPGTQKRPDLERALGTLEDEADAAFRPILPFLQTGRGSWLSVASKESNKSYCKSPPGPKLPCKLTIMGSSVRGGRGR